MDIHRLAILVELSRLGSMSAVADVTHSRVSTVSQQIATLAKEVGTPLVEPDGRGVRLTSAGRRLAAHAVMILAAVDAARSDLDPDASPAGTVRIAGYASALNRFVFPLLGHLSDSHPEVRLAVQEMEPEEALSALLANDIDAALIYDHNLAPLRWDPALATVPLWDASWHLLVPGDDAIPQGKSSPEIFSRYRDYSWIANPRNPHEETVLRVIGAMAGFEPRIDHRVDNLDLLEDLVRTGSAVGLVPEHRTAQPGTSLVSLMNPAVTMRIVALTKRGNAAWPPLALVLDMLRDERRHPYARPDERA